MCFRLVLNQLCCYKVYAETFSLQCSYEIRPVWTKHLLCPKYYLFMMMMHLFFFFPSSHLLGGVCSWSGLTVYTQHTHILQKKEMKNNDNTSDIQHNDWRKGNEKWGNEMSDVSVVLYMYTMYTSQHKPLINEKGGKGKRENGNGKWETIPFSSCARVYIVRHLNYVCSTACTKQLATIPIESTRYDSPSTP